MPESEGYRNSALPIDARVRDLLSRMTLEEKAGQLRQILGFKCYDKAAGGAAVLNDAFRQAMREGVGALYGLHRADPWSQRTLETGLLPREAAELANEAQRQAITAGRHGIPLLLAEECPHGLMAPGTTMFPAPIGLACTWDVELVAKVAGVIAAEIRACGANIAYGPVLDLARDPRWSRCEETFGEDPHLAGRMGVAMVRAIQDTPPPKIVATLKHFAAYGETRGGHNGGATSVGQRELHSILMPPFEQAVAAGAGSLMSSYNELDGVPCTASRELLTDVLRGKWGFAGFVVSDLYAIDGMTVQGVAADLADAAAIALKAGVDLDLGGNAYGPPLLEALRQGKVTKEDIDLAAARVLRAKFTMGLFEKPYVEPAHAAEVVGCEAHREVSLAAARQSIVLLKNDGVLPLAAAKSIAVVGPNADNVYNQLGDYTPPQAPDAVTTVLAGLRDKLPSAGVTYAKGCGIRDLSTAGFDEAARTAEASDVIVAVIGGSSSRYTDVRFTAQGQAQAAGTSAVADMDCGEGFDRATLNLDGVQMDLLKRLAATGKPLVVVLINGRPMLLEWIMQHATAVLEAWYPGPLGGTAVAEVLTGKVNPSGKLAVSMPRSAGHLPAYYNHTPLARGNYLEGDPRALLPFGLGLSYTTFQYSNLRVAPAKAAPGQGIEVAVDVTNTGRVAGDEIVQLYIRDVIGTVMTPVKALKGFGRVSLSPGERKTMRFGLSSDDLALLNIAGRRIVEPGEFHVMVGGDSENILKAGFEVIP